MGGLLCSPHTVGWHMGAGTSVPFSCPRPGQNDGRKEGGARLLKAAGMRSVDCVLWGVLGSRRVLPLWDTGCLGQGVAETLHMASAACHQPVSQQPRWCPASLTPTPCHSSCHFCMWPSQPLSSVDTGSCARTVLPPQPFGSRVGTQQGRSSLGSSRGYPSVGLGAGDRCFRVAEEAEPGLGLRSQEAVLLGRCPPHSGSRSGAQGHRERELLSQRMPRCAPLMLLLKRRGSDHPQEPTLRDLMITPLPGHLLGLCPSQQLQLRSPDCLCRALPFAPWRNMTVPHLAMSQAGEAECSRGSGVCVFLR